MTSGVAVSDEVVLLFNAMKVHCMTDSDEKKRQSKKAAFFCIKKVEQKNGDQKETVVVDACREILTCDVGVKVKEPYNEFVKRFPEDECRYALYDVNYTTKESPTTVKDGLILVMWAPENACIRDRMIYASTKEAIKKQFQGIKAEIQANEVADLSVSCLIEKLGRGVISLEGCPC